jgi:hypothetical protein
MHDLIYFKSIFCEQYPVAYQLLKGIIVISPSISPHSPVVQLRKFKDRDQFIEVLLSSFRIGREMIGYDMIGR